MITYICRTLLSAWSYHAYDLAAKQDDVIPTSSHHAYRTPTRHGAQSVGGESTYDSECFSMVQTLVAHGKICLLNIPVDTEYNDVARVAHSQCAVSPPGKAASCVPLAQAVEQLLQGLCVELRGREDYP